MNKQIADFLKPYTDLCDLQGEQDRIVALHEISENMFNTMTDEFFPPPAARPPKSFTEQELKKKIAGNLCVLTKIQAHGDETNTVDNNEIDLLPVDINSLLHLMICSPQLFNWDTELSPLAVALDIKSHFSIPLFRGLFRKFPNATYHFSKGTCPTCKKISVVFQVKISVRVKYCADLTELFP